MGKKSAFSDAARPNDHHNNALEAPKPLSDSEPGGEDTAESVSVSELRLTSMLAKLSAQREVSKQSPRSKTAIPFLDVKNVHSATDAQGQNETISELPINRDETNSCIIKERKSPELMASILETKLGSDEDVHETGGEELENYLKEKHETNQGESSTEYKQLNLNSVLEKLNEMERLEKETSPGGFFRPCKNIHSKNQSTKNRLTSEEVNETSEEEIKAPSCSSTKNSEEEKEDKSGLSLLSRSVSDESNELEPGIFSAERSTDQSNKTPLAVDINQNENVEQSPITDDDMSHHE